MRFRTPAAIAACLILAMSAGELFAGHRQHNGLFGRRHNHNNNSGNGCQGYSAGYAVAQPAYAAPVTVGNGCQGGYAQPVSQVCYPLTPEPVAAPRPAQPMPQPPVNPPVASAPVYAPAPVYYYSAPVANDCYGGRCTIRQRISYR